MTAGVVGHDRDLKAIGIVEQRLVRPRLRPRDRRQHDAARKLGTAGPRLIVLMTVVGRGRHNEQQRNRQQQSDRGAHG